MDATLEQILHRQHRLVDQSQLHRQEWRLELFSWHRLSVRAWHPLVRVTVRACTPWYASLYAPGIPWYSVIDSGFGRCKLTMCLVDTSIVPPFLMSTSSFSCTHVNAPSTPSLSPAAPFCVTVCRIAFDAGHKLNGAAAALTHHSFLFLTTTLCVVTASIAHPLPPPTTNIPLLGHTFKFAIIVWVWGF